MLVMLAPEKELFAPSLLLANKIFIHPEGGVDSVSVVVMNCHFGVVIDNVST